MFVRSWKVGTDRATTTGDSSLRKQLGMDNYMGKYSRKKEDALTEGRYLKVKRGEHYEKTSNIY